MELDRLRCVVERITYQSDGYSVLKCAAKGYTDLVAVVGMIAGQACRGCPHSRWSLEGGCEIRLPVRGGNV